MTTDKCSAEETAVGVAKTIKTTAPIIASRSQGSITERKKLKRGGVARSGYLNEHSGDHDDGSARSSKRAAGLPCTEKACNGGHLRGGGLGLLDGAEEDDVTCVPRGHPLAESGNEDLAGKNYHAAAGIGRAIHQATHTSAEHKSSLSTTSSRDVRARTPPPRKTTILEVCRRLPSDEHRPCRCTNGEKSRRSSALAPSSPAPA